MTDSEYPFEVRVKLLFVDDNLLFHGGGERIHWASTNFGNDNFQTTVRDNTCVIYKFKNESDSLLFALRWL